MKIAIDIGYGHTKVMTEDGVFKIPSAIALNKTTIGSENNSLSFEGKNYIVGEDATRNAIKTRDYAFIYKYAPLIIYHVFETLGKLDDISTAEISTGLSLYDIAKAPEFDSTCKNRAEEFIKRVKQFTINNNQYTPEIKLFAQGQGVWQDYCLSNGYLDKGYEVVVDIGYRTNDVIIFKDGRADKSDSNADDKGINEIVTQLKTQLNKKYDINFTEQEVNEILKDKVLFFNGVEKDVSETINEIVDGYIETLMSSLKADYSDVLKISRRVIISGGGAYILNEYKDMFPANVVFDEKQEYEFANVRGYYNG